MTVRRGGPRAPSRRAQLALAQQMQTAGQLACGIAHDVNNLLTAMAGAAESAGGRADLPPEVIGDLAQIRASADRGAALVRQLLAFGRPQTVPPPVLALNDVVSNTSGLLRRLLGSRIRLDLELDEAAGQVRADPVQLDRVLVNLAVNARDAMPEGGRLIVRTGPMILHGARHVRLDVTDTGHGIRPEILPRIFEPFFTTRQARGGTGLGLSTVQDIVRQAAGVLEVESVPGEGTTIRIILPGVQERSPAPHFVAASRGTVLLVEDEAPVRRLVDRALSRAGWRVVATENGEQALAALEHEAGPLAGLVTDMAMHGMDGIEVLRAIRARAGQPTLPVLLVSGFGEALLRHALAGESRVEVLAKPYELRDLVAGFAALAEEKAEQNDLSFAKLQVTNI